VAVRPTGKRPAHTCPEIDKAVRELQSASRDAMLAGRRSDDSVAADALRDAESTLDSAVGWLEKLRKSNAELRDSAEEWESYALELEEELSSAEKELGRLERIA